MNIVNDIRSAINDFRNLFGMEREGTLEIKIGPIPYYHLREELQFVPHLVGHKIEGPYVISIYGIDLDNGHFRNDEIVILNKTEVEREQVYIKKIS